jgi:hypothetical protein
MQGHGNGIRPMYATSSSSDVYHLLIEAETADSTLCGLVKTALLYLTTNRPTDRDLSALDLATRRLNNSATED